MTQKELKQISNDLIKGVGKEKLSTLTEEEKIKVLGILKERYLKSVDALQKTMEETTQVITEAMIIIAEKKRSKVNVFPS